MDYLIPIVGVCATVLGWVVAYTIGTNRDKRKSIRDIRSQYLLEAYLEIEAFCSTPTPVVPEKALAKVQLMGGKKELLALDEICKDIAMNSSNTVDVGLLLTALRSELRRQMGLPKDIRKIIFFRG